MGTKRYSLVASETIPLHVNCILDFFRTFYLQQKCTMRIVQNKRSKREDEIATTLIIMFLINLEFFQFEILG
jgi:hypothetical protein